MSSPLDTTLPSTRLLQHWIRDRQPLELILITGEKLRATLSWQDPECLCVSQGDQPQLLWRRAIARIQPLSPG